MALLNNSRILSYENVKFYHLDVIKLPLPEPKARVLVTFYHIGRYIFSFAYYQRRLNEKTGDCIYAYPVPKKKGSARSSMRTTHPFHCPPETLIHFDLAVNLVGGANVVCLVSLLINKAIYTTL